MILKARYIGCLAKKFLTESSKKAGRIRIILPNTFYAEFDGNPIVITRKRGRAPLNINLNQSKGEPFQRIIRPDLRILLKDNILKIGNVMVDLRRVETYECVKLGLDSLEVSDDELIKASFILSRLYDLVEEKFLIIYRTSQFNDFLIDVVKPFANGFEDAVHDPGPYRKLMGLGQGFTPAGDDFLSGFLATLNASSKAYGFKGFFLNKDDILSSTSWASGMLLYYSQHGYVGEGVSRVIQSLRDGVGFLDALMDLAKVGHTSGLDLSLGILIASSMILNLIRGKDILNRVIRQFLNNF
ncbi:MAG TPA: DUF2877 domain-containing protein [Nitrososphaeria archaeon]|nr:DUF2877 domain-containing protein [Nitrososphaeria archaeon]